MITAVCPDLVIRLTGLRGEVSRLVWEVCHRVEPTFLMPRQDLGNNPNDIQICAIGTTAIPSHLPRYHQFLHGFYDRSTQYYLEDKKGMNVTSISCLMVEAMILLLAMIYFQRVITRPIFLYSSSSNNITVFDPSISTNRSSTFLMLNSALWHKIFQSLVEE